MICHVTQTTATNGKSASVITELIEDEGEPRYKITDIIGKITEIIGEITGKITEITGKITDIISM